MKLVTDVLFTASSYFALACLPMSAANAAPTHCMALTPAAFDALIQTLEDGVARATLDCNAFCANGAYAVAAQLNRDSLADALAKVKDTKNWLDANGLAQPHVTNATAAYNVHGMARDNIATLHHARHWATISAIYHGSSNARLSFDDTTTAIGQLEALGMNGGACYVDQYAPFPN